MQPEYKKVKVTMPHCPECKKQLGGNNSIASPWKCACGIWVAKTDSYYNHIGYEIKKMVK